MSTAVFFRNACVYVSSTFLYGTVRALTYDYEGSKRYYNAKTSKSERKELLITDTIGLLAVKSTAAMVAWPIMICDDMRRLECFLRGKDIKEYE